MKRATKIFDHFDMNVIILPLILMGFLLARFATPLFNLLPPCTFRAVLKIPCPSCGVTRASLALAQGEVMRALSYHPLFVISLGVWLAWSVAHIFGRLTGKSIPDFFPNKIQTNYSRLDYDLRQREFRFAGRWLVIGAIILNWLYLIVTA